MVFFFFFSLTFRSYLFPIFAFKCFGWFFFCAHIFPEKNRSIPIQNGISGKTFCSTTPKNPSPIERQQLFHTHNGFFFSDPPTPIFPLSPTSEMAAAVTCVERFLFSFLFIGENEGRVCVSMMLGGLDRA